MQALKNEVAIMADIRSDYVVKLTDGTKTANNIYLAMELCNGGDLDGLRKARGMYLPELEARVILQQVVKGLMVIKQKNVIHRDLKLPNVLINFKEMPVDVFRSKIAGKKVDFNMQEYLKTVDLIGKRRGLSH